MPFIDGTDGEEEEDDDEVEAAPMEFSFLEKEGSGEESCASKKVAEVEDFVGGEVGGEFLIEWSIGKAPEGDEPDQESYGPEMVLFGKKRGEFHAK